MGSFHVLDVLDCTWPCATQVLIKERVVLSDPVAVLRLTPAPAVNFNIFGELLSLLFPQRYCTHRDTSQNSLWCPSEKWSFRKYRILFNLTATSMGSPWWTWSVVYLLLPSNRGSILSFCAKEISRRFPPVRMSSTDAWLPRKNMLAMTSTVTLVNIYHITFTLWFISE